MSRPIPSRAVDFVAQEESLELEAYADVAGIWTIGYGHTGPEVVEGMKITKTRAKQLLREDMAVAQRRIAARVKAGVIDELSEAQYSALLSFVFNLGANPKWTIWSVLNKRQFDQVPAQLMRFVNAGKPPRKVKGLVNRRLAECALWNSDAEDVRVVAREIDTPPSDATRKPLMESRTIWSAGGSAVLAASAGVSEVHEALAPTAGTSDYFDKVLLFLTLASAFLALAVIVCRWLDHRREQN